MVLNGIFLCCLPLLPFLQDVISKREISTLFPTTIAVVILSLFLFVVLCYTYFQLYAFLEMSLTIQMIVYIFREGSSITTTTLQKLYPFSDIIRTKISHAIEMGAIQEKTLHGTKYFYNSKFGTFSGAIFQRVKQFLNWGVGG